jgi:hypothetical protein
MRFLPFLLLLLALPAGAQVRTFVLGEGAHAWEQGGDGIDPTILVGRLAAARVDSGNSPDHTVEYAYHPGWLSPRYFTEDTNLAPLVLEEGGSIRSPNLLSVSASLLKTQLEGIVNGDHEVAFERKPTPFNPEVPTWGIWVVLNFPRLVGIHRVRFYPRNTVVFTPRKPFQDDYLRGYELWINDQLTSTVSGAPDALVARVPQNDEPVVEVEIPPQYVRLVKLRSLAESPFEIDEIEVYGSGYLSEGVYYSDLIDLGDRATIGAVRWAEAVVGEPAFSQLEVRARTGNDDTPILYRKATPCASVGAPCEDIVEEITAEEYWALNPTAGGARRLLLIDDEGNWSTWKPVENGALNPAPGPRRYVQFQLDFKGRIADTREVDRLEFDYLRPPIADTLRGEVFPRLAEAEKPATFRYAVLLRAAGQIQGFDRLEVDTNVPAEYIRNLTVNGEPAAFAVEEATDRSFRLQFPLIDQDQAVLEFTFDLPIFRFGTTFSGRAYHSRFPAVPQQLEPGQVVRFGPGDADELSGLAVSIPRKQIGRLVGEIALNSRILTPNGDGIHDQAEFFFNLLQLVAPAPVSLEIYDLSGRRVHTVFAEERGLGPATYTWDGRSGGRLVPPGHYIWVLRVKADAFEERHSGVLSVAY